MRNAFLLIIVAVCFSSLFSCQKELNDSGGSGTDTTGNGTPSQSDLLKDSVYLYTKEVYFWHEVIPSYDVFNPRGYTGATDEEAATNEMDAIRAYQPLDRYSFVTTNAESEGLQTGTSNDFGFLVKAASLDRAEPVDSVYWFVNYVYDKSPAGIAGVERGWYVSKINNTPIAYDNASIDILNNTFFGTATSATFEFTKPDGTTTTSTLNYANYTANSVLYENVLSDNAQTHKIGYLVFNQFFGQTSRNELANAFNDFAAAGINDLIVDLRYNRGGSTATQDTLANLIAPASANGKKMYTYIYNDSLQAGKYPLLYRKDPYNQYPTDIFTQANNVVNFEKAGAITGLTRVFFIVSGSSASASELLINNLRPYMDVKLVGDTTYGKPVGFFPIDIFNYSIYPISFKTVNSQNVGDYYSGFVPDKLVADGVNKSWGDVTEPCLGTALYYISNGTFGRKGGPNFSDESNRRALARQKPYDVAYKQLTARKFSGSFVEKGKMARRN
ncbi:S41 family peptidase [Danxiaibacter flavus]|uniref:S41 family peptidase n=1 Tax=Danxiaibacter flavus TaxID=3049108 RepID=A0ABV3ZDB9_9BACT|nr:S41 family peptidase [Chitinophagaceae bacterium DXS]